MPLRPWAAFAAIALLATAAVPRVAVDQRPLDVVALVRDGRVFVPMRALFDALGARVRYEAGTHLIAAEGAGHSVRLQIGDRTAIVDGRVAVLDAPARVVAATTYVPLRFVSQALGAVVGYDRDAQLVTVALTPRSLAADTPAPLSTPDPATQPDIPVAMQFFLDGANGYGDGMDVVLIAPPGGRAYITACGSDAREWMWNDGFDRTRYRAHVVAPYAYGNGACEVQAFYVAWNGRISYVPSPVYVTIYPREGRRPHTDPTPAPGPTWQPGPQPTYAPQPTPHPTARPTPEPTEAPTPEPPAPDPIKTHLPEPRPLPERTPPAG